jgi:Ras-related protein Rab-28
MSASETSSDADAPANLFKVVLLGDGAVGKTSIATVYTQGEFGRQYKQTIGLDFFLKRVTLPGDIEVTLQVWDIGGQSIGSSMLGNYIYGAHAVVLCYDITNYQSFLDLEDWFRLVHKTFGHRPLPYVALVGNKTDISHLRTVKLSKHQSFAALNDFASFFVSARTGDNVTATFYRIAADLAHITLKKPDLMVRQDVVKAVVPGAPVAGLGPSVESEKRSSTCAVM